MDSRSVGMLLVAVGAAAIVLGLLVASGALSWFGQLPGDIRYEGKRTRVFIPLTSMIIVSLVLSLLAWILRR